MNPKQLELVKRAAIDRYTLPIKGIHGLNHWNRVYQNGMEICKHTEGCDSTVVSLFAYLHDCCRVNEGSDPQHGPNAAEFAVTLLPDLISLSADQMDLLIHACTHHERGRVTEDPTIGACWDADRLDLGRVSIRPKERLLSTKRAKKKSVLEWAWERSRGRRAKLKR